MCCSQHLNETVAWGVSGTRLQEWIPGVESFKTSLKIMKPSRTTHWQRCQTLTPTEESLTVIPSQKASASKRSVMGKKSWLLAKYQSFAIDQIHLSRQGHDSTVSLLRVHLRCWKITSVLQFRGAYHKHQIKKRCFALLSISGSSTWNQDWGHRRGRSYIQSLKIRSRFQC